MDGAPRKPTREEAIGLLKGGLGKVCMSGAERTRRYRERIDQGVQLVTVPVSACAIHALARLGFLPDVKNVDATKLRAAIADLMRWVAKQPTEPCDVRFPNDHCWEDRRSRP